MPVPMVIYQSNILTNKEEKITLPVISTFIEHKSTKILFDTGCHPNVYTEPEKRWGQLAKIMKLHVHLALNPFLALISGRKKPI